MKPGHPIFTAEFDKQRSIQRRLLASLPDSWIIDCERIVQRKSEQTEDKDGLIEFALRRQADQELTSLEESMCGLLEETFHMNLTRSFLVDKAVLQPELRHWFKEELESVPKRQRPLRKEQEAEVRLVCLLLLADQLSNDGYVDSRVTSTTVAD